MIPDAYNYLLNCQQCGNCCKNRIEGASIFLYIEDIERIAAQTNYCIIDILHNYTDIYRYSYVDINREVFSTHRIVLKTNGSCVFLAENKCIIHKHKPFICKYGPFIPPIIESRNMFDFWRSECPGLVMQNQESMEQRWRKKELNRIKELYIANEINYFNTINAIENNIYKMFIKNSQIKKTININT